MIQPLRPSIHWFILSTLILFSCKGKDGDSAATPADDGCAKPLADAGSSEGLPLGSLVTANGNGSSWCGTYSAEDIGYTWTFEDVPTGSAIGDDSLSDNRSNTAVQVNFVPDIPGEYVLSLRVNDPDNASESAYVIYSITSDDVAPTSDCGADQDGNVGIAATLDGSQSLDPEGAELAFTWSVTSTPDCSILNADSIFDQGSLTPSIIPDCAGLFVVSLVVNDGLHESDPDFCTIDVAPDNHVPVASAGDGGVVSTCADNPFQLNGWASYDDDGGELAYMWSVVSTPEGADPAVYGFTDEAVVAPYFTWDVPGEWAFVLQVSDGIVWSAPDPVAYTVNDSSGNNAPTADAGGDLTITTTAGCNYTPSYVMMCESCDTATTELDGSGSSDPDEDSLSHSWSEESETLTFSNTDTAITSISFPATETDYGVTTTSTYEVQLDVADCSMADNDRITITYQCTGVFDSEVSWADDDEGVSLDDE